MRTRKRAALLLLLSMGFVLGLDRGAFADSKNGKHKKNKEHREYSEDRDHAERLPPGKRKKRQRRHSGDEDPYRAGGGPPPWAPAHGYRYHELERERDDEREHERREHEHRTAPVVVQPVPVPSPVYVPPFGIDTGRCRRDQVGALLGGAAGGLLGSTVGRGQGKVAAIVGGAIAGILVGGSIGRAMDSVDMACVGQVLEHAPTQQTVEWKNPDDDLTYDVTPTRTFKNPQGEYCREFRTTALIGGKSQEVYGTACRQPDGSWKTMK